jgi:hypothetical protein
MQLPRVGLRQTGRRQYAASRQQLRIPTLQIRDAQQQQGLGPPQPILQQRQMPCVELPMQLLVGAAEQVADGLQSQRRQLPGGRLI